MANYSNPYNTPLSSSEMKENAKYFATYLLARGWTLKAICAALGNWESECTLNPNDPQYASYYPDGDRPSGAGGFGLAQWTPYTTKLHWYCEQKGIVPSASDNNPAGTFELQIEYHEYECTNGLKGDSSKKTWYAYKGYSYEWEEFKSSDDDVSTLAKAYYWQYERSGANDPGTRPDQAETWYDYLTDYFGGDDPDIPIVPDPPSSENNAELIAKAVTWAKAIANDESHGYDQENRWGLDYDCSSLIIQAYDYAGVAVKANGATYTGDMIDAFVKTGFTKLTYTADMQLMVGDVLWLEGHTAMMVSDTQLVEARINELGTTTGGQTGDQTGTEILVRDIDRDREWWWVLRLTATITPIAPVKPEYRRLSKLLMFAIGSDRF